MKERYIQLNVEFQRIARRDKKVLLNEQCKDIEEIIEWYVSVRVSQMVLVVKNPPTNAGDIRDVSSIPGSGRSPGGGNGYLLHYFCLENRWTEEPGNPQSMGREESDTTE